MKALHMFLCKKLNLKIVKQPLRTQAEKCIKHINVPSSFFALHPLQREQVRSIRAESAYVLT